MHHHFLVCERKKNKNKKIFSLSYQIGTKQQRNKKWKTVHGSCVVERWWLNIIAYDLSSTGETMVKIFDFFPFCRVYIFTFFFLSFTLARCLWAVNFAGIFIFFCWMHNEYKILYASCTLFTQRRRFLPVECCSRSHLVHTYVCINFEADLRCEPNRENIYIRTYFLHLPSVWCERYMYGVCVLYIYIKIFIIWWIREKRRKKQKKKHFAIIRT